MKRPHQGWRPGLRAIALSTMILIPSGCAQGSNSEEGDHVFAGSLTLYVSTSCLEPEGVAPELATWGLWVNYRCYSNNGHIPTLFHVNERSFIVDLGPIPLSQVPQVIDPADYPADSYGEHGEAEAIVGHVYALCRRDPQETLCAAIRVSDLLCDQWVNVDWYLSMEEGQLTLPL